MATVDAVGVPWLALFHGSEEHLIEAERVGTITFYDHVGIDHVEHRFRHFLYGPSTDIFSILKHKLSIFIFRSPCLEGFDVEDVIGHDVDIHMDGRRVLVLVFESETDEDGMSFFLTGYVVTIDEVASSLDHALVDKFLEGFFFAAVSVVVEEFVPEPAVDQVSGGMLRTAHIEIHVLPVFIDFLIHQGLVVVWIHVAQVVGARPGKTRHGVQFKREDADIVDESFLHDGIVFRVPGPFRGMSERGLSVFSGFILADFRQFEWQTFLWNHVWHIIFVIHGEWLTPVTLT